MAPTVVLVPASFTPPEVYSGFVSVMQKHGLETVVVSLPSVGSREDDRAPGTMSDDAAEIARVTAGLYDDQGKEEVVLLTHSYGGIPASESMKFLSTKNRRGRKGIDRIIYLAAIVLPVGVSNDEMRKRPPPEYVTIDVRAPSTVVNCFPHRSLYCLGRLDHNRPRSGCAICLQ